MRQREILIISTSILGVIVTTFLIFYSLSFLGMAITESIGLEEGIKPSGVQFNFSGYKALNLGNQ